MTSAAIVAILFCVTGAALARQGSERRTQSRGLQSDTADLYGTPLSRKDRNEVFEDVWNRVNEKYYDPDFHGVNWKAVHDRYKPMVEAAQNDGEFYSILNRMVGELHDAHTRFHTPEERREREDQETVSCGISLYEVEGKVAIVTVAPGSQAESAGVRAGMIVTAVNGVPVARRLDRLKPFIGGSSTDRAERLRLYHRLIDGPPGSKVTLDLLDKRGAHKNVTLTLRIVPDTAQVTERMLASGYGYVRLTLWKSPVHDRFKEAVEQLKPAPGLILDLRGNPGGEVNEVLKIAGYFFSHRVDFGEFYTRSGKQIPLSAAAQHEAIYSGPVAILVNESSGSGSELFAEVMQEAGRAAVIGRQSCGCLLGISQFKKLKGGGELAVSELGYISPKGRRVEGKGVSPDEATWLTVADLQSDRDAVLDDAENALRTQVKASSPIH